MYSSNSIGCLMLILMIVLVAFGYLLSDAINLAEIPQVPQTSVTWQEIISYIAIPIPLFLAIVYLVRKFGTRYSEQYKARDGKIHVQLSREEIAEITRRRRGRSTSEIAAPTSTLNTTTEQSKPSVNDSKPRASFPRWSVVAIMRGRRMNNVLTVIGILTIVLLASMLLSPVLGVLVLSTRVAIFFCILLLALGHLSFEYRVGTGLFGNNESEARDIIEFLIQEAENIDFTDGGKAKKILSEEDLREIEHTITSPKESLS